MSVLIDFLKSLAERLGVSPSVLLVPFSFVALSEFVSMQYVSEKAIEDVLFLTSILGVGIFFLFYFISVKFPYLSLRKSENSSLIFRSTLYSVLSFCIAGGISIAAINSQNSLEDQALYHTGDNKGLAIASLEYVQLGSNDLSSGAISEIIEEAFVEPLNEIFDEHYTVKQEPNIVQLPTEIPQLFSASLLEPEINYSSWAEERGYDIVVYGEAQQGDSDKIFLDLDFDVFDEPKTVEADQSLFKLYYTVSNYDSDALLASFDNMVKQIGGITLYLDEKYTDARTVLESVIESLEREIEDYSDENAASETERKSFEVKREKLLKNLGIVYFYLGNSYLLEGDTEDAQVAYQKTQEYLGVEDIIVSSIESWSELALAMFTAFAAESKSDHEALINNLSIAYARNGDFEKAEKLLIESGAEESEDLLMKQNLGLVYLEQGMGEVSARGGETADLLTADDSGNLEYEESKKDYLKRKAKENTKLEKARVLLAKVEKEMEEKNLQEERYQEMKKNTYHNQAVLHFIDEDFDEAEEYLKREMNLIKEKKKIRKEKTTKRLEYEQQKQENFREEKDFFNNNSLEREFPGSLFEQGESLNKENEAERYRNKKPFKDQVFEEENYTRFMHEMIEEQSQKEDFNIWEEIHQFEKRREELEGQAHPEERIWEQVVQEQYREILPEDLRTFEENEYFYSSDEHYSFEGLPEEDQVFREPLPPQEIQNPYIPSEYQDFQELEDPYREPSTFDTEYKEPLQEPILNEPLYEDPYREPSTFDTEYKEPLQEPILNEPLYEDPYKESLLR